jgi:beta-glucosidase
LAPTINIQRSPLGGRAFESFSEDPTLSGQIAAAYINGLQGEGISATIKHFVGNDQEHERMGEDSIISQRALREVYLRPFQIAQKLSKPWAYMTSYNKVNGTHVSEHKQLLQDILRKEWQHDGLVMSDWYGTYSVSESINAGLDLEMPGPARWHEPGLVNHLIMAHKIDPRTIDRNAGTILRWAQKLAKLNSEIVYAAPSDEKTRYDDKEADAKVIRRVGAEGIVVLKNENSVLPVTEKKVAVIGPNVKARVLTGGGSAQLRAAWSSSPWEGLESNKPSGVDLEYSLGCAGAKFLPQLDENFTTLDGKKGFNLSHYKLEDGKQASESGYDEVWDQSDMFLADFFPPGFGNDWFTELKSEFTSPIDGEYEFGLTVTGQGWLWVDDKLVVDNSKDQKRGEAYFGNGTEEVKGSVKVEKGKVCRNTLAVS